MEIIGIREWQRVLGKRKMMNDTFPYIDEKNKKGGKKFYKESCSDFFTYIQIKKSEPLSIIVKIFKKVD